MDALQKQLATLQTIVPEDKQADQFIIMIQSAAVSSGVSIRRMKALPIASKQYYFEMPFEVEADGPYFSVLDFFSQAGPALANHQCGRFEIEGHFDQDQHRNFHMSPGSSVTGDHDDHHVLFKGSRCGVGQHGNVNRHNCSGRRASKAIGQKR